MNTIEATITSNPSLPATFETFERNKIYQGNALDVLKTWPDGVISCVVTSPPYWALRKYKTEPQIWDITDPNCVHEWATVDVLRKTSPGDVPSKDSILGRQIDNHTSSGSSTLRGGKIYPGEKYNRDTQLKIHESHNGTGKSGLNGLVLKDGSPGNYGETSQEKRRENSELRPGEPSAFCSKCGAWKGHLGLEPTVAMYVSHLCDIFDEVHRVLRDDGTCFVDMGDSFSNGAGMKGNPGGPSKKMQIKGVENFAAFDPSFVECDVPAKSMCMVPWLFMIEMVHRGWILRNVLSWDKAVTRFRRVDGQLVSETIGSCMPSSVTDNFTPSWEPVFFFVKSNASQVYYNEHTLLAQKKPGHGQYGIENEDWHWIPCPKCNATGFVHDDKQRTPFQKQVEEWVRKKGKLPRHVKVVKIVYLDETEVKTAIENGEQAVPCPRCRKSTNPKHVKESYWASADYWFERQFVPLKPQHCIKKYGGNKTEDGGYCNNTYSGAKDYNTEDLLGANMRSAIIVNTSKTTEKHFATFSTDLVRPLLRAGCPKEICSQCGLPRYPVIVSEGGSIGKGRHSHADDTGMGNMFRTTEDSVSAEWDSKSKDGTYQRHLDYTHCACNAPTTPGFILDMFFGTGTDAIAAMIEHRSWVGIELSEEYIGFAEKRITRAATETAPTAKHKQLAKKTSEQKIGSLEAFANP
jgi:hypothetical protein